MILFCYSTISICHTFFKCLASILSKYFTANKVINSADTVRKAAWQLTVNIFLEHSIKLLGFMTGEHRRRQKLQLHLCKCTTASVQDVLNCAVLQLQQDKAAGLLQSVEDSRDDRQYTLSDISAICTSCCLYDHVLWQEADMTEHKRIGLKKILSYYISQPASLIYQHILCRYIHEKVAIIFLFNIIIAIIVYNYQTDDDGSFLNQYNMLSYRSAVLEAKF